MLASATARLLLHATPQPVLSRGVYAPRREDGAGAAVPYSLEPGAEASAKYAAAVALVGPDGVVLDGSHERPLFGRGRGVRRAAGGRAELAPTSPVCLVRGVPAGTVWEATLRVVDATGAPESPRTWAMAGSPPL